MGETQGERLKRARLAKGLSQPALAQLAKISKSAVSQLESGDSKSLHSKNLYPVANTLGVSAKWLATGDGPMKAPEPEGKYEFATRVHGTVLSAGPGRVTWEHEEIDSSHAFRRDWLLRNRINIKHCKIIDVVGDSMSPHLQNGDVVLINTDDRLVKSGEVYAIAVDGETRIKRLIKRSDGGIEIKSDNPSPDNPDEIIGKDALERINIIGKKVWRGG